MQKKVRFLPRLVTEVFNISVYSVVHKLLFKLNVLHSISPVLARQ